MKSRGVYETPGGTLLYAAHSELEQLVLDRRTLAAKDLIAPRYADLVYEGRWWTTEREAYDAFVNVTQERVTGTVTLKLYKGNVTVAGRQSAHALYDERFVTFGEDDVYQQADAAGFIRLYGLAIKIGAGLDAERQRQVEAGWATSAVPTECAQPSEASVDNVGTALVPQHPTESAPHQMWGGRFALGPSEALDALNRSLPVDHRLWPQDVAASKAWVHALGRVGVDHAGGGIPAAGRTRSRW